MYVMIKATIGKFCGLVEIIWAIGSGNPNSPPGYWLYNLSAHPA